MYVKFNISFAYIIIYNIDEQINKEEKCMKVVPTFKILKEERKRSLIFSFSVPNFKEMKQNIKIMEKMIGSNEIKEIRFSLEIEYFNDF